MPFDSAALVWFRRDLRAHDHAALHAALKAHGRVHCAFVFDTEILDALPTRTDRRVEFIWESVRELADTLAGLGGALHVLHGKAREEIPRLAARLRVHAVYANHDYEPQAIARDAAVVATLQAMGIALHTRKDQVIFEKSEVLTQSGTPFSVFTPYKNAWLAKLEPFYVKPYPVEGFAGQLSPDALAPMPTLESLGFARTNLAELAIPTGASGARALLDEFSGRMGEYHQRRDFPALKGPSYLSVHLRFGTVSIRELVSRAWRSRTAGAAVWLSELVWRDFYFMILAHHPRVERQAFRPEYEAIRWDDRDDWYAAWCEARTGYPIVDAAMRQLNRSGYMHNRLRMIVASFLTKDLGLDWRRGEAYFAQHLNDFDLAANNGGWQWAASTGCDAQPWFRIFNPVAQSERFDAGGRFIRRYLPELARVPDKFIHAPWKMGPIEQQAAGCMIGRDYPAPLVDHAEARLRTLERYAVVKKKKPD
ncbi:MAG: deoxyribodipyrimidine photo-lyase [Betaproteobacteria bacterium]|nr:deoxyribodipyrimidine photo-lyase [Betaproteobacteria bacterium]